MLVLVLRMGLMGRGGVGPDICVFLSDVQYFAHLLNSSLEVLRDLITKQCEVNYRIHSGVTKKPDRENQSTDNSQNHQCSIDDYF